MSDKEFTPALGYRFLTPLYDLAISLLTREQYWRGKFVEMVEPKHGDRILDVGCGTGSLAIRLSSLESGSEVIGLDPDPNVWSCPGFVDWLVKPDEGQEAPSGVRI